MTMTRNGRVHGSRACYQRGCRNPECVLANRVYQREYRLGEHGTRTSRRPGLVLGSVYENGRLF
jgi:hypothetical protein